MIITTDAATAAPSPRETPATIFVGLKSINRNGELVVELDQLKLVDGLVLRCSGSLNKIDGCAMKNTPLENDMWKNLPVK